MADSTPLMNSTTCVPHRETKPFVFIGFVLYGATKRNEQVGFFLAVIARSVRRDGAIRRSLDALSSLDCFVPPLLAMAARRLEKVAQKRS
jgi:hypothetical protein